MDHEEFIREAYRRFLTELMTYEDTHQIQLMFDVEVDIIDNRVARLQLKEIE